MLAGAINDPYPVGIPEGEMTAASMDGKAEIRIP
jgi:hypothetical protein